MRRQTIRHVGLLAVTIAVVGVCSFRAFAQETLQQLAQSAKEKINPPSKDDSQKRLSDVRSAADRLGNYLQGANGEAWKDTCAGMIFSSSCRLAIKPTRPY